MLLNILRNSEMNSDLDNHGAAGLLQPPLFTPTPSRFLFGTRFSFRPHFPSAVILACRTFDLDDLLEKLKYRSQSSSTLKPESSSWYLIYFICARKWKQTQIKRNKRIFKRPNSVSWMRPAALHNLGALGHFTAIKEINSNQLRRIW